uniref:EF-hand domain-containing protein n=1 Tax=Labrus bergylta TaxID=56723 RepID=A0A3Q3EIC5_9LABR
MTSPLCLAMGLLIDTFDRYAGKDGDNKTLTRAELEELLHNEMPTAECRCQHEVCEFFNSLDLNKDGVVDFKEYIIYVAALTAICKK